MKSLAVVLLLTLGTAAIAFAQGASSQKEEAKLELARTVNGQVLSSRTSPAVHITFDKAFKYAGGQTFILYDVALAEQHFFVDAAKDGKVKRLYWVQFEGYLPSNTHTYEYNSKTIAQLAGLDFFADAYPVKVNINEGRPNSDGQRAQLFLESKGYRVQGADVLMQRLVHLTDESKRNELMIIYVEDLGGSGLKAADLEPQGRAAARWQEVQKGLLKRATEGLRIMHVR